MAIEKCDHHGGFYISPDGRSLCTQCGGVAGKKKCSECGREYTVVANAIEDKSIGLQNNKAQKGHHAEGAKAQ